MKKHMIRMALAGALAFGVASVSKAADEATAPVFSVVAQELATQSFGTLSKTSTTGNSTSGDQLSGSLQHVILGTTYSIDALDTLTVKAEAVGGFTLTDAYDTHSLADLSAGLSAKVGQQRIAFGADGYTSPDQLIRTGYSTIDGLIPGGKVADGGSNYDLGLEFDQNYSDLTLQVAAVQNPNAVTDGANTVVGKGNGTQFDYVGRAQWKGSNVALGLSDYYQASATGGAFVNNVNTLGANASVNVDVVTLDLEAIFGAAAVNGYTGTLSAKFNGFQPAAWYEWTEKNSAQASGINGVQSNDLGAGVNFWLGSKTRLAVDVDFTGYNGGTNPAGDLFAKNTETVQLSESF